jgi:hypothetical protein
MALTARAEVPLLCRPSWDEESHLPCQFLTVVFQIALFVPLERD